MKKIFSIVAIAAFSMLLVLGNGVQAQTRQQKKDAKKEAKRLKKEGYQTMMLPIERQLSDFYAKIVMTDDEGMPKYLVSDGTAVGRTYAAAKVDAMTDAKTQLAGQINTTVMDEVKRQLGNQQLSAEDAATYQRVLDKSTLYVAQKLSRVIVAQEYYRTTSNKNYEVKVVLLYDSHAVKDMLIQNAEAELKKALDNFTPEHERALKEMVDGIKAK